jgi:hypothetical protein
MPEGGLERCEREGGRMSYGNPFAIIYVCGCIGALIGLATGIILMLSGYRL